MEIRSADDCELIAIAKTIEEKLGLAKAKAANRGVMDYEGVNPVYELMHELARRLRIANESLRGMRAQLFADDSWDTKSHEIDGEVWAISGMSDHSDSVAA